MAKARPIDIGTRTFPKAGDAETFFKAMLNKYRTGTRVADEDGRDLLALLDRHDERAEKIGVGVAHFMVLRAPDGYTGKCFWITRTDGTKIDISYKHCLEKKPGE